MRKSSAALSVIALTALALTGCSAAPSFNGASCERDSSPGLEAAVDVTGDLGTPRVDMVTPVRTSEFAYADVIVGDGRAVTASNQNLIAAFTLYRGDTGEEVGAATQLWDSTAAAQVLPGMDAALPCVTDGSRVVTSVPASDIDPSVTTQLGLNADDSIIAVVDVLYVALPKAEGHDVFNTQRGLPSVVRATDGRPGVIIPDGDAPTETVTETLIEGDGEAVGDGFAMFHSTVVSWDDRSVLSTTWDGPLSIDPSALPAPVVEAVQAATVGSQILVVVPGEAGASATAYVVDVLGVVPPELAG